MQSVDLCFLIRTKKSYEGHGTEHSGSGNIGPLPPEQSWQQRRDAPSTSLFLLGDQVGEVHTLLSPYNLCSVRRDNNGAAASQSVATHTHTLCAQSRQFPKRKVIYANMLCSEDVPTQAPQ